MFRDKEHFLVSVEPFTMTTTIIIIIMVGQVTRTMAITVKQAVNGKEKGVDKRAYISG